MWSPAGYAQRLREAHKELEKTRGDLSQEEIGRRVGVLLDAAPIKQTRVGGWFRGAVPSPAVLVALGRLYGVDPGWLLFGPDSAAPAP